MPSARTLANDGVSVNGRTAIGEDVVVMGSGWELPHELGTGTPMDREQVSAPRGAFQPAGSGDFPQPPVPSLHTLLIPPGTREGPGHRLARAHLGFLQGQPEAEVAQVSQPAVSPTPLRACSRCVGASKSADRPNLRKALTLPAALRVGKPAIQQTWKSALRPRRGVPFQKLRCARPRDDAC